MKAQIMTPTIEDVDRVALFNQEWALSNRDMRLHSIAKQYHDECESFDRTVCTGPIRDVEIMPATHKEMALINKNAIQVRKRIETDAMREGFTREELIRAIRNNTGE
ncbi:MAG TPA: hypothetical protein VIY48_21370 [Candidatus Paceibacterota bacterium]